MEVIISSKSGILNTENSEAITGISEKSEEFKASNLDGSEATWILIVTLISQNIPALLKFIKDTRNSSGVKSIKVGDVEIENPTDEMIDSLMKRILEEE